MEVAKVISRRHFAWQCFYQARKNFHSSITSPAIKLQTQRTRIIQYPSRLHIGPITSATFKVCNEYVPVSKLRMYCSKSPSSSDTKDESSSQSVEISVEETENKEDSVRSLEESKSNLSVLPESEVSSSDQGNFDWEDPKLDKLYKVIELEVLAYEPSVLDSYQWFVVTAATHLGIQVGKCWSPTKPKKMRFPLLKSAFVHKKHQVHYEVRTHHRFLTFHKLTSSTADTFLEYIERNLPEGVGLKVTRVEAKPLPDYLQRQAEQQQ